MNVGSLFDRIAAQAARQVVGGLNLPNKLTQNMPMIRSVLSGDLDRIGNSVLDNAIGADYAVRGLFPLGDARGRSSLIGGITLSEAKTIFEQTRGIEYARKNLWRLEIEDLSPRQESPSLINLLATDVSYAPWTITGDAVRIGTGYMDTVQAAERVEMRVTTMDDAAGSLKKWFEERSLLIGHADGTIGLPVDYLVRVTVTHAVIGDNAIGAKSAKKDVFIMRPGNIEYDLSRRDQAMSELQMTFVQFDTFCNVV